MGQKLSGPQRDVLLNHPQVAAVTHEHIFLKDGRVLDPSEFTLNGKRAYLIRKLQRCRCGRHRDGEHVLIPVCGGKTILGTIHVDETPIPFCPNGDWVTEETLTAEEAMTSGLLDAIAQVIASR